MVEVDGEEGGKPDSAAASRWGTVRIIRTAGLSRLYRLGLILRFWFGLLALQGIYAGIEALPLALRLVKLFLLAIKTMKSQQQVRCVILSTFVKFIPAGEIPRNTIYWLVEIVTCITVLATTASIFKPRTTISLFFYFLQSV